MTARVPCGAVTLTTGRGPLSPDRAGRFNAPVPEPLIYIEPYRRRVRGLRAGRTVVDSERVLLAHRPGLYPCYVVPADDVVGDVVAAVPEPEAPGHVRLTWDAVDSWIEEDEPVVGYPRNPYHRVECLRTSRRLRAEVGQTVLVDTASTIGVYETALAPRLYVRRADVRMDVLVPSPSTTFCAYKGVASYWSAVVGDVTIEDVAWCYDDPRPECETIRGLLSFDEARATVTHDLPPG